jgi:hypothetical protein
VTREAVQQEERQKFRSKTIRARHRVQSVTDFAHRTCTNSHSRPHGESVYLSDLDRFFALTDGLGG